MKTNNICLKAGQLVLGLSLVAWAGVKYWQMEEKDNVWDLLPQVGIPLFISFLIFAVITLSSTLSEFFHHLFCLSK